MRGMIQLTRYMGVLEPKLMEQVMSAFQRVANLIVAEANPVQRDAIFYQMWDLMSPEQKLKLMKTDAVKQTFPQIDFSVGGQDEWVNSLVSDAYEIKN